MGAVFIPAPHGRLEGLLSKADAPVAAVVVCHPHPLYGGNMHHHIPYRLADAFRQAGVTALRFNFRGVGLSTGAYDEGRGELEDAQAALELLAREEPSVPLYAAGFSFGAWVALALAAQSPRVEKALAVGVPLELMPFSFVEALGKPVAFVHADADEYGRLSEVRALVARAPGPKALFVVEGADHMCLGRLGELSRQAAAAVDWLLQSGR
jgi:alpha/beta superfamily hydrolase